MWTRSITGRDLCCHHLRIAEGPPRDDCRRVSWGEVGTRAGFAILVPAVGCTARLSWGTVQVTSQKRAAAAYTACLEHTKPDWESLCSSISRQTCCEDDSWLYQASSALATAGVALYEKLTHC